MGLESHTWKMSYTSTAFKNLRLNEIIKKGRAIKRAETACANALRQRSTERAQGMVRRLEHSEQGGEM